ncbi:hypothetical protein P9D43_30110 [Neobacillus niacini]|uniref:hypothetical protein n=1 Tax=Neobacillus niacini TaxID=86668 RepID=UPI002DBB40A8|nr:hypothetical protein [Neobacillus niacini]MEC1526225.1 hypothetical protein [Neobacillus niacini]
MLEPVSLYRLIKLSNNKFVEFSTGLLILQMNLVYEKELISHETNSKIIQFAHRIKNNENPFVLTEELMLNAKRSYINGFYKECILHAQSSVETLLRTLFSEFLKLEGHSVQEVERIQSETSFLTMVKREFSKRIGGSWDISNNRKEIGSWYKRCYELRNKIIHAGYDPTHSEVDQGLYSANNLRFFVIDRLKKSKKYSNILLYL